MVNIEPGGMGQTRDLDSFSPSRSWLYPFMHPTVENPGVGDTASKIKVTFDSAKGFGSVQSPC